MMTKDQFQKEQDSAKTDGFRQWMQQPMPRALIASVPPCENLQVLLQAAFEAGFGVGSSATAVLFIEAVMRPPR